MLKINNFECNISLDKVWLIGLVSLEEEDLFKLNIQHKGKRETLTILPSDIERWVQVTGETWNLDALIVMESTLYSTRFNVVRFNPHGDGVTALYINGVLDRYGDYYHDKIDEILDGFEQGLKYANFNYTWKRFECHDEETNTEICEYADSPDKHFKNLKGLK